MFLLSRNLNSFEKQGEVKAQDHQNLMNHQLILNVKVLQNILRKSYIREF